MSEPLVTWVSLFSKISSEEGRRRAESIVSCLNNAIANDSLSIIPDSDWSPEWKDALSSLPVQPISLSIPWRAFQLSLITKPGEDIDERTAMPDSVKAVLATVPLEYQDVIYRPEFFNSQKSEYLLQYLAEIIKSSKEQLFVMAPFWSKQGIDHLQRAVGNLGMKNIKITILTPANMKAEDYEGCMKFKEWLADNGALVDHLVPRKLSDHTTPFLHAKLLLSDKKYCYIGSANFSESGLHRSIEIGIGLQGSIVTHLEHWLKSLIMKFEIYDVEN